MLAYLRLIRLPNVFTSVADVLAGYCLVFGPAVKFYDLFLLMIASACIYGGGCALNDVCDFDLDLAERPSRPIPSGAISYRAAVFFSCILLGCGLGAAALIGLRALLVAGMLVLLVICYDCWAKNIPVLGSFTMAACRGGNLILGMVPGIYVGSILAFPVISMCYVFGLTTLSKFETSATPERYKAVAGGWLFVALAAPVGLVAVGVLTTHALVALAALLLLIAPPLWRWLRHAVPKNTGGAVKSLVLGIPLLDAVYVSGVQDWTLALPLIGCLICAVGAAKWMHVS